jgi:hypothetical protein
MKCKHIKNDGSACKARVVRGTNYCWFHSPGVNEIRKQHARYKGGINRHRPAVFVKLPEIKINGPRDLPLLLSDTYGHMNSGAIDVRLGTAICYLTNILLKAYEPELEARIEKMEKFVEENFNDKK